VFDPLDPNATDEKIMLHNIIITVAHKVYLEKLVAALRAQKAAE